MFDLRLVADDRLREARAQPRDDGHLLLLRLPGEDRADIGEHAAQAERLRVNGDAAGLDLGEVEHVLDERGEVFRALAQRDGHAALLRAEVGLLQHAREADDAVERVADLVAHVGDEVGLGGVGARELLGAAAHQRLELPGARPQLVHAEPVAAVDPAGGGEREHRVGPEGAVPRRQDEEGVRGRRAPPAGRAGGAHLEGVGALAEVGELAEVFLAGWRPVALEPRELGLVAHVLGVAIGGGGEFELQAVARVGQAGGLRGEERQPGLAGGRNRAHGAQQGVEGHVQVLQFVQLHAQQAFRSADPEHRLPGRLLLIIEHGGRAGVLESADRKLAPCRSVMLIEGERAHDGVRRAVGQRRLGGEPYVACGVGVGEGEAFFQSLQRVHRVERVVHRVVRENAGICQQQHVVVEHADLDTTGAGRQHGAGLEGGDFRRRAGVAKRDAQDALGIHTDP